MDPRPVVLLDGRSRITAAIVVVAALGGAVVETTCGRIAGLNGVAAVPWWRLFRDVLPSWAVAAALVPVILVLARSFPFRGRRAAIARAFIVHLCGAAAFVCLHLLASVALSQWIARVPPRWIPVSLNLLRLYSFSEIAIYAIVVGTWNAVSHRREALARERDAAELRRLLTEARLDALRLQLQPHFLFNTLHAIVVLARRSETETLVSTVARLGDLLRVVLDDDLGSEVPLERELELLGKYLDIQRVRFRDRLSVDWSIEASCRAARVPPLLLQPVVENAMIHGLDARPGPGRIGISARRFETPDGPRLRLVVEDSGPGLTAQPPGRVGIGLANTHARLRGLHADRATLEAGNAEAGGARITIEIPFVTGDEEVVP